MINRGSRLWKFSQEHLSKILLRFYSSSSSPPWIKKKRTNLERNGNRKKSAVIREEAGTTGDYSRRENRGQNAANWGICSVFHPDVDAAKASLENVPGNMYESVCVPDLGDFLGYQSGAHQGATPEHKSPATPASSATSNSSGPQNAGNQPTAPLQPPSAAVSLPSRQYHNDGKCLSHFIYPLLQFPQKTNERDWTLIDLHVEKSMVQLRVDET